MQYLPAKVSLVVRRMSLVDRQANLGDPQTNDRHM